ncbi:MAG TPA: Gfo/Idh/MocA family oxidoreductase [Bacteroides sp.]|nr:Gfo/Idh/MocA family oxidoreductase [Bacteroides sp.]
MDYKEKEENRKTGAIKKNNVVTRRRVLKSLAGVPVLAAFSAAVIGDWGARKEKAGALVKELGLDQIPASARATGSGNAKDLIRVGIIGFGSRAIALANGLGYMHPDDTRKKKGKSLENWMEQANLNVAVTAICEVFDLRAKLGMETVQHDLRPGGGKQPDLPVKRVADYREMLDDKKIDAVVIATPDHWHARMTIDAIQAGKHVYCEKCISRTEEELYQVYDTVRGSDRIYQQGHQITKNRVFQQAGEIINRGLLGSISLVETTSNRNSASGAWIRHLDGNGNPLPGSPGTIDWKQWLGPTPYVPFSIDRYYNWTKWFNYGTGLLGQLFSHEFDAVNQLLRIGIPGKAFASGGIYFWKDNREIPDLLQVAYQYPDQGLSLTYSGNLASSYQRSRKIMGRDATMELGASLTLSVDAGSARYKDLIERGVIDPNVPMINLDPSSEGVDAVSSATEQYYASRGLTHTFIDGIRVDVTHLHLAEWLDCIRNGGVPAANIERSFEEGVAIQMAQKSYLEGREVTWDADRKKIV